MIPVRHQRSRDGQDVARPKRLRRRSARTGKEYNEAGHTRIKGAAADRLNQSNQGVSVRGIPRG